MTTIFVEDDTLHIHMDGLESLFALRRTIAISLANIQTISTRSPSLWSLLLSWRVPGTYVPGIYAAGTYYQDGQRNFWNVRRGQDTIVIDLKNEKYDRLILGVDDAQKVIDAIQAHKI